MWDKVLLLSFRLTIEKPITLYSVVEMLMLFDSVLVIRIGYYHHNFFCYPCCFPGFFYFRYKAQLLSSFLRGNGVTLFKVREEIIKLLGKSDMYFFSPEHPSSNRTGSQGR